MKKEREVLYDRLKEKVLSINKEPGKSKQMPVLEFSLNFYRATKNSKTLNLGILLTSLLLNFKFKISTQRIVEYGNLNKPPDLRS